MADVQSKETIEIFIIDSDQPATCPLCGVRTEFEENEDENSLMYQMHKCENHFYAYKFIGVFENEGRVV